MALDDALLEAYRLGHSPATLRTYRWDRPTLSLGYAQRPEGLDLAACEALGVDVVRRPTGGRAVLHAGDFTYAVVLGKLPTGIAASYRVLASALSEALAILGVETTLTGRVDGGTPATRSAACFATTTQADLRAGDRKLLGSAQVRRAGAVLQHGSLYLTYPEAIAAKVLPTIQPGTMIDLATLLGQAPPWETIESALITGFSRALGLRIVPGDVSAWERERADERSHLHRLPGGA